MKKKSFIFLGIGAMAIGLAVSGFLAGHEELAHEQAREKPVDARSRVVSQGDGTAVVFDADTRKRADIAVTSLKETSQSGEIAALAIVLQPQELNALRNDYVAAKAQWDRSIASVGASRREFDRIKALHQDERNVSDKTLDTAQAAWRLDAATAGMALETLRAVDRSARQKWGAALASAVEHDAPLFRRLSEQRQVLMRVALPARNEVTRPATSVRLDAGDGISRIAKLISPAPQADPRTQGPTFFYVAPADGLLPGTTLTAYLPLGASRAGAIVPAEAVVWWQGKAWFYAQAASDRFARRELVDEVPVEGGWFVPGLHVGPVVVRGAQLLLSEELRAQIQVGEENE